jgi:hypothetical protein
VGALRYFIDQPRRIHKVGNLVLATGGRRHARSFWEPARYETTKIVYTSPGLHRKDGEAQLQLPRPRAQQSSGVLVLGKAGRGAELGTRY